MPTYDYQCDGCDHEFELFQRITESPKKKCPRCGQNKLRRLFGAGAAIVFKGSGFYQTDYRSESYRKAAESEKKQSEAKSDSGATTASDKGASADAATKSPAASSAKSNGSATRKSSPSRRRHKS
jgi:putative FmdB family regulatory protein